MVASGPSAAEAAPELQRAAGKPGLRVLAINDSWRLVPQADALYGCDGAWWRHHQGAPEFKGLKLTGDGDAALRYGLQRIVVTAETDRIRCERAGEIGSGGNSGFQALNLAVQFGVRRVVLVGYDMRIDRGVHWHGRHARGLNNPNDRNIAHWRRALDRAAEDIAAYGVDVVNASPVSALTAYRRLPLSEAIA